MADSNRDVSPAGLSGLNDLGQVAYRFELASGDSGIAIWSGPGAIPEPSSLALLGLGGLSLLRRSRSRSRASGHV